MSLAAFPHPNERHATPPPYENSISKHMGMLFLEKNPRKTTHERVFWKKVLEKQRPKAWSLSQTSLTDPLNGRLILKTTLTDPLKGHLILKTTLADPPNGHRILKTTLTDPLNGHQILKATLADPPNGHQISKTPLQTARRQVFHEKQRKPFRPFGSTSSPHGMQQKAGCRERIPQQPAFI